MSNAVKGAAMLGGALAMGVAAFFDPVLIASPLFDKIMAGLVMGGIAAEAGAVAEALMPGAGMAITTRAAAALRQVIYGEMRVTGVEIYRSTTGSHRDQRNYIIVFTGHEIENFVNIYFDGRQVYWQGSGFGWSVRNGVGFGGIADGADHTGPDGQKYNFGGTGHSGIYVEARFGDQADGDVIGAMTANDGNWVADGHGNSPWVGGCAYLYVKLEFNTNVFPTDPVIEVTVRGKNNIWDPRDSTFKYTNNADLVRADVLVDTVFGLGDDRVNQDQLIAAANVCDEMVPLADGINEEARYTINYAYDSSVGPGDALEIMKDACAGRLSDVGGEYYLWPAYWQGPSFTFDKSALTGPITWYPNRSLRDLFNRVRGTYIAPNYPYNVAGNLYDSNGFFNGGLQNNFPFGFKPTNFPQFAEDVKHGYASDAYLTDDGRELVKEISLRCVLSIAQAQRVAKIMLERNRQQGSGTFPMHLSALAMQGTDLMEFTMEENGWTDKVLEIVTPSWSIEDGEGEDDAPAVKAAFVVQETAERVYEWDPTTEELSVYDVSLAPVGIPLIPEPPTGLTLLSDATTALVGADGIVTPRILATWTAPADARVTQVQIQHSPTGAGTWVDDGAVDASTASAYISGVVAGSAYDVRIRSLAIKGQTSDWEEVDNVTVAAPNSLQTTYTNNPQFALTQPTSTTIAVAAVAVTFGGVTVNYAARTLTISAPSVPTPIYVTIADPTQAGESGSPTLTATASTSNSLVGVLKNTYIGSILALPAGSATRIGAGGWPAPASFQVVP